MIDKDTVSVLANRIYELIAREDYVSFAEILNHFGADGSLKGECAVYHEAYPNCLFWVKMSEEFAAAVTSLIENKRVHLHPSHPLVYLHDGHYPSLPLAKRPPKKGYKKPHWAPVILRTQPFKKKGL